MTAANANSHEVFQILGAADPDRAVTLDDVEAVREVLGTVVDPCSIATGVPISLLDMGIVKDVQPDGTRVHVSFQLTSPACMQVNLIAEELHRRCLERGIQVRAEFDPFSEWMPDMMADSARQALRRLRPLPLSVVGRDKEQET